jgi:hypothetical protein
MPNTQPNPPLSPSARDFLLIRPFAGPFRAMSTDLTPSLSGEAIDLAVQSDAIFVLSLDDAVGSQAGASGQEQCSDRPSKPTDFKVDKAISLAT